MAALRTRYVLIAAVLALGACGGSDGEDTTESRDADTTQDAGTDTSEPESENGVDDSADEDSTNGDSGDSGRGTATLSLANGQTYEFSVLCTTEPQMAAGSEILFTATSYDDPSLDITQFGDEGTVTGLATVSMYDPSTFDSLWGASSIYEPFGGGLELTIDGSTITGVGTFFEGDDPIESPEGVDGEVVANC